MLKRIAVFASLAVLVAGIFNVPASAAADPKLPKVVGDEKPVTFTFRNVPTAQGSTQTVICTTSPSPRPQFSGGGGGSIHWGAKTLCNVSGQLKLDVWVVQYINGYEYVADSIPTRYGAGFELWGGDITRCIGYDPTYWQVKFVPLWNGIPGEPPMGQSAKYLHNCE